MNELLSKIREGILDILIPKKCIGCGREGLYICKDCEIFLSEVENNIPRLTSVWEYEGLMEKLIYKIKFDGHYDIINELVEKAFEKIELNLSLDTYITYITYVPMYKKKEKQRGFNQAELIAKKVGEKIGRPVVRLLKKVKNNRTQVGLTPKERLENVKGVFGVLKPSFNSEKLGFVKSVLLVDDVYTTGATANECVRVLRGVGIKNIQIFTLARRLSI